jgi:hypothetical protein
MSLVLSDEICNASGMSEAELTLEIIILLFQIKKISIGKAAHLAKMNLLEFRHQLVTLKNPTVSIVLLGFVPQPSLQAFNRVEYKFS